MNKFRIRILAILIAVTFIFTACEGGKQVVLTTGFQDEELFRIDSDSCYAGEALVYLVNTKNQYRDLYGNQFLEIEFENGGVEDSVNQAVLSNLTRVKVMNIMARKYLINLDDSDLELIDKAANEYYGSLTNEEKTLFGVETPEDIAAMYKEYRLAEKVYEYIVKDIAPEISDDEARTMLVKEIFFNTEGLEDSEIDRVIAKAYEVRALLDEDVDFDSIAAVYSDNEQSNLSYTKMSIDEKIKDQAFNLSKDEISDVLVGDKGIYILYCVDPFSRDETETTKEEIINGKKLSDFEMVYNRFVDERRFYINEDVLRQIEKIDISSTNTMTFYDIYYKYFK